MPLKAVFAWLVLPVLVSGSGRQPRSAPVVGLGLRSSWAGIIWGWAITACLTAGLRAAALPGVTNGRCSMSAGLSVGPVAWRRPAGSPIGRQPAAASPPTLACRPIALVRLSRIVRYRWLRNAAQERFNEDACGKGTRCGWVSGTGRRPGVRSSDSVDPPHCDGWEASLRRLLNRRPEWIDQRLTAFRTAPAGGGSHD